MAIDENRATKLHRTTHSSLVSKARPLELHPQQSESKSMDLPYHHIRRDKLSTLATSNTALSEA
ncbi:hypothetical protein J6590_057607 [Homalodisca vitripennis]|nr:hypothetical protein J6590_057607 [Homalodisca vitripennis]